MAPEGLAALEAQVRRDLQLTRFPEPEWVPAIRAPDGSEALDVLIVGAGQGGQAVATALQRERVARVMLIDRAPAGIEVAGSACVMRGPQYRFPERFVPV